MLPCYALNLVSPGTTSTMPAVGPALKIALSKKSNGEAHTQRGL